MQSDDRRVVLVNFGPDRAEVDVEGEWIVDVSSCGEGEGERERFDGRLAGDAGLVLRPAQLRG
jgi:hypothetical protein